MIINTFEKEESGEKDAARPIVRASGDHETEGQGEEGRREESSE
jgi:hypothetical protein